MAGVGCLHCCCACCTCCYRQTYGSYICAHGLCRCIWQLTQRWVYERWCQTIGIASKRMILAARSCSMLSVGAAYTTHEIWLDAPKGLKTRRDTERREFKISRQGVPPWPPTNLSTDGYMRELCGRERHRPLCPPSPSLWVLCPPGTGPVSFLHNLKSSDTIFFSIFLHPKDDCNVGNDELLFIPLTIFLHRVGKSLADVLFALFFKK